MSGFKNWNNDNNGKTGNNSNLLQGNNAGFINNNFQWKETRTELSTEKKISIAGSCTAFSFVPFSDVKLKNNINSLSNNKKLHLDNMKKLIPKSYNFNENNDLSFGLIAQDVEKIYPNLVKTQENGLKGVDYTQLIPLLLLQSKEMERKIEELKNNN